MKANELMIGDWFQTTYPNGKVEFRKVEGVMQNHIVCNNGVTNAIEPIPLTAEILEKNGFVEQEFGWRKLNAANWCININIFNGKERYALSVLGINAQVTLHGYYVHELQHALRLCGIDKEIVL